MDKHALEAFFSKLDRSLFIEGAYRARAELDKPLPIGCGQTISQPSLVLDMTWLLSPEKSSRVLEIVTGSGYQTAFLAEFAGTVYTVEQIAEFTEKAKARLTSLGYQNVCFRTGDGSDGWPEAAPFDRIIVTAAAGTLPETLADQLAPGGRMLCPVGSAGMQVLKLVTRDEGGAVHVRGLEWVRFVEMKGRYGWDTADNT